MFAATSTSHAPICACSRTPFHSMLLCFQIFFTKVLLLFLLNSDGPHLRPSSSVHHRSLFCSLVCFFIAFSDELFEKRHLLHFLLGMMRFDVLTPPPACLLYELCTILPNQDPQVGVLCSWANACPFSSPQTINDSFVVDMDRGRTDSSPDGTQKAVNSTLLRMATWFRKPSTGMLQLLCFSIFQIRTAKWVFFQCPFAQKM